jgi:tetraacyldisaccharide 4'-kinase
MQAVITKNWSRTGLISTILSPLSWVYWVLAKLNWMLSFPYKSSVRVICVGNAVAGGAGKTPTAIVVAKMLIKQNKKVCFLSRGYKGVIRGPVWVSDSVHKAEEVGDEPLLLAKVAPCIVAKDRVAGLKYIEKLDFEIVILDDGLQNNTVTKDSSLLVVDGDFGVGNGKLLPAGPLRERLRAAMNKVKAVMLIGEDKHNLLANVDKPVFNAKFVVKNKLDYKKAIAFSGIGNPEKFFNTLREQGVKLVNSYVFPDHHQFLDHELEKLCIESNKACVKLVTTSKDYARISRSRRSKIEVLEVDLVVENEDYLVAILK